MLACARTELELEGGDRTLRTMTGKGQMILEANGQNVSPGEISQDPQRSRQEQDKIFQGA